MDQKQYLDLKDMIDGGGAGQMGDTFQGGGLLSLLANAFAKPYGSEDPVRKRERMKAFGLLGDDMPKPAQVQPVMRTGRQVVPTYGADAGVAATNRAMNVPYNQTQAMPGYNTPAPNPVAEMPASDFMNILNSAKRDQQVPFGGYQKPSPGTDMLNRLREMGIDVNSMSAEQLQNLMTMYMRGGPFNYGMGR